MYCNVVISIFLLLINYFCKLYPIVSVVHGGNSMTMCLFPSWTCDILYLVYPLNVMYVNLDFIAFIIIGWKNGRWFEIISQELMKIILYILHHFCLCHIFSNKRFLCQNKKFAMLEINCLCEILGIAICNNLRTISLVFLFYFSSFHSFFHQHEYTE